MHFVDHPSPTRQRGPHNDPSMLDGDSAHGNPGDVAGDEWAVDTDTDVVDEGHDDVLEDVVADPAPETEEEVEEFEADAGPDRPAPQPRVADVEPDHASEVGAEVGPAADDLTDEALDERGEEDSYEGDDEDATPADVEPTSLEVELEREMDRDSIDPAKPAKRPTPGFVGRLPTDDYLSLTIPQVLERVAGMDAGQVAEVLEFERANKNRKTLVAKLERMNRS